jgi:hypothetical protein
LSQRKLVLPLNFLVLYCIVIGSTYIHKATVPIVVASCNIVTVTTYMLRSGLC